MNGKTAGNDNFKKTSMNSWMGSVSTAMYTAEGRATRGKKSSGKSRSSRLDWTSQVDEPPELVRAQ